MTSEKVESASLTSSERSSTWNLALLMKDHICLPYRSVWSMSVKCSLSSSRILVKPSRNSPRPLRSSNKFTMLLQYIVTNKRPDERTSVSLGRFLELREEDLDFGEMLCNGSLQEVKQRRVID